MAAAYPIVPKPASSRIPSLRTSVHFRRHSSQLGLLKANLQRKLFIEREEKRVSSAGVVEYTSRDYQPSTKRQEEVPKRRNTTGEFRRKPTKQSPINKAKQINHNRRYSKPPLIPQVTQSPPVQSRDQLKDAEVISSPIIQASPLIHPSFRSPVLPELINSSKRVKSPGDFEIDPRFIEHRLAEKKSDPTIPSPIDWNLCTEIERQRTPTPLHIPDEGDANMFRRGTPLENINKMPIIPPIQRVEQEEKKENRQKKKSEHQGKGNKRENGRYSSKPLASITPSNKIPDTKVPEEVSPDEEKIKEKIKKKEEELLEKIANEEKRLALLQTEQAAKREANQKKRLEEQKKKRLLDLKQKKLQAEEKKQEEVERKRREGEKKEQDRKKEEEKKKEDEKKKQEKSHRAQVPQAPPSPPPPARPTAAVFMQVQEGEQPDAEISLVSCGICGRKFGENRLAKHMKICNKVTNTTRKTFDTTKKRAEGTDYASYVAKGTHLKEQPKAKRKDWKAAHEEFQKIVKCARTGAAAPPLENPDYETCPHCNRKFNESAAKRHIPLCGQRNQNKRPPMRVTRAKK